jgi:inosine-uridine nucleoside N-ribohydrolase
MQVRKKQLASELKLPSCKYVIIDTDAGGDDSQAIVLAISEAKRTGKTILGITCIDGNAALDDVAINVLISVSICGADIPVYKGTPPHTQAQGRVYSAPRTRTTTSARTAWDCSSKTTCDG